jgi:hypothetical protein
MELTENKQNIGISFKLKYCNDLELIFKNKFGWKSGDQMVIFFYDKNLRSKIPLGKYEEILESKATFWHKIESYHNAHNNN